MKWIVEMKGYIFRVFINLITFAYVERIFHENMSEDVKKFFKDLSIRTIKVVSVVYFCFMWNIVNEIEKIRFQNQRL